MDEAPEHRDFRNGCAAPCVRCWTGLDGHLGAGKPEDIQSLRSTVIFCSGQRRDATPTFFVKRADSHSFTSRVTRGCMRVSADADAAARRNRRRCRFIQSMPRLARADTRDTSESIQYLVALSFFSEPGPGPTARWRMRRRRTSVQQDAPTLIRLMMQRPWAIASNVGAL